MAQNTLLIIDDDDDLREALAEQLALEADFKVETRADIKTGVEAAHAVGPDLIILDVDLPDGDGREACARLRAEGISAPIILLTAAATDADAIQGLDAGADDYVTKPFKFAVLAARIRAHLRAHEQSENAIFHIGPYEFRPAQKLMIDQRQKKIRLTEKETAILKYLYRAPDKFAAREALLAEVWGYNAGVTTHTLETHIYRLRQKIEPEPTQARILITDAGGYRLVP